MTRLINDATGANIAYLKDVDFKNGVIECDMYSPLTKGQLSFAGLIFRAQDSSQYECVYFRPFSSGTIHAVQYIPIVEEGFINWMDYEDDAYKAISELPE